jgi:hypothetical protein
MRTSVKRRGEIRNDFDTRVMQSIVGSAGAGTN